MAIIQDKNQLKEHQKVFMDFITIKESPTLRILPKYEPSIHNFLPIHKVSDEFHFKCSHIKCPICIINERGLPFRKRISLKIKRFWNYIKEKCNGNN